VFCHRVIQHTPNPEQALYSISKYLKKKGSIFLHSYSLEFANLLHYHYILRPFTKNLNYSLIYKLLQIIGPILYPIVGKIHKMDGPRLLKERILRLIPFDNLDHTLENSNLSTEQKYLYSLLHVFDRLTPKYDNPSSAKQLIGWFKNSKIKVKQIKSINPVIITGEK